MLDSQCETQTYSPRARRSLFEAVAGRMKSTISHLSAIHVFAGGKEKCGERKMVLDVKGERDSIRRSMAD